MPLSRSLSASVFVVATAAAFAATQAVTPPGRHVTASLLAATDAVQPGKPLTVGVRLQMQPGWHTYWRNPGDTGLPTRVRWTLPPGFEAGEIRWPRPSRFATGPVVSYGYEHEVVLPVEIRVPASLAGRDVKLQARVDWLECQEACLPGKAELSLALPVRPNPAPSAQAALLEQAHQLVPSSDGTWGLDATSFSDSVALHLRPPQGTRLDAAYFYPSTTRLVDYAQPQRLRGEKGGYRLVLVRDPNGPPAERLQGVLALRTAAGERAIAVDVKMDGVPRRQP
jgi:thiol:disulfide interchange protein DsbD